VLEPINFTVSGIKNVLNKALFFEHKISFEETGAPNEFKLVSQSGKSLILPSAIAFSFAVSLDTEFKDGDVNGKMNLMNYQDNGPNQININCNAINHQPYGSNVKDVIRVTHIPKQYTQFYKEFNPIQYMPLVTSNFDNNHIKLTDSADNLVMLYQSSETVVVLHLCPKT